MKIRKLDHPRSIVRIFTIFSLVFSIISCSYPPQQEEPRNSSDFSRLVELMQLENKYEPLYAFNDYQENFDPECHEASLDYLKNNPALIQKIKSDLDSTKLKWEMVKSQKRIAYVPEIRSEYADLYLSYCRAIIDFIIAETKLENPYIRIRNPARSFPDIPEIDHRVTVFLVHNLAKQYVATYSFSNDSDKTKVNISLSGTVYTGEIGSYASMLEVQDDGQLEFVRNNYTIWQNSAKSPVNTLILPLEETLHIALRPYTEGAIVNQWNHTASKTIQEARRIAGHWIAVEEAVAGGLAHHYFPQVADKYIKNFKNSDIDQALDQRAGRGKYRYLKKGIRIIENEGPEAVLDMYRKTPQRFRDLLVAVEKA